ncbi:MAG: YebC/PmpR family DNA-binding transcriptional regulator [Bernardetiaceae bacterium]
MAGHSKWANIKHRKAAQDAKRSKVFTKLIKEITVATREGGDDPEMNPRLRLAVQNAKGANMPKDTIERAIQKGSGVGGATYTEMTYEGYAPHGVAIYIEASTDNTNRTVANVRAIFNKANGSLSTSGSLDFIFERKGIFIVELAEGTDPDELLLELADAGAEDVETDQDSNLAQITCALEDFGSVQKKVEELGLQVQSANLDRIPLTTKALDDEAAKDVLKVIEKLEDDDDVNKVYHNLELTESQLNG